MVDGGGSLRVALMGDQIGAGAIKNGWKVGLFQRFSGTSVAQYVTFLFSFVVVLVFVSFFIFSFWSCSCLLAVLCLVQVFLDSTSIRLYVRSFIVCIMLCCVLLCVL